MRRAILGSNPNQLPKTSVDDNGEKVKIIGNYIFKQSLRF